MITNGWSCLMYGITKQTELPIRNEVTNPITLSCPLEKITDFINFVNEQRTIIIFNEKHEFWSLYVGKYRKIHVLSYIDIILNTCNLQSGHTSHYLINILFNCKCTYSNGIKF